MNRVSREGPVISLMIVVPNVAVGGPIGMGGR
jgi:hypothetical protein